jgi:hypothetical protein
MKILISIGIVALSAFIARRYYAERELQQRNHSRRHTWFEYDID